MAKRINFIVNRYQYAKALDTLIDPIIEHLPQGSYSKDLYYINGDLNINFFTEDKEYKDLFISHGIADKCYRDKEHVEPFEKICVSGPAWRDKMVSQGVEEERILINGYTKLDPIYDQIKNSKKIKKKEITVLYAPTHNVEGVWGQASCHPRLDALLEKSPKYVKVISSLHPVNKSDFIPTLNLYSEADVVISDCSSTLYEALALGIPVVFPDWLIRTPIFQLFHNSFEQTIFLEKYGLHADNIRELWNLVFCAYEKGIDSKTNKFMEGIFPTELRGVSGKKTAELFLELAEK